jgi:DNA-binding response OmpR family regulator
VKILVVEDEKMLSDTIVSYLKEEGYLSEQAGTLDLGTQKVNLYEYDCVLLDIGLPDGNGFKLINEIKKCHPETGIIIISAKNSLDDKIQGLDLGADDYLTKPFHLSELNSRIKSVLRRRKFEGQKELVVGKLRIFPENRRVFVEEELLSTTRKEFDLLLFFVSNQGRVLTKESIAEHLWGDFADSSDTFNFVYSHIKNLRRKILVKSGMEYFRNVYGTGYIFELKDKK